MYYDGDERLDGVKSDGWMGVVGPGWLRRRDWARIRWFGTSGF